MDDQRRYFLVSGTAMTLGASLMPLLAGCGGSNTPTTKGLSAKPVTSILGSSYFGESGHDCLFGSIAVFSFSFTVPRGWLLCNGQILPISQNDALFYLLQNRFGGDGRNTFALPNLTVPAALNPTGKLRYYIATTIGFFPARN